MIKMQFNANPWNLHIDNSTEYFNCIWGEYLSKNRIVHQSSCTGILQPNCITKEKNCHLLEVAKALMFTTYVPKQYLGEAILIASYLINQMPSRVQYQKPLDVLLQTYPQTWFFTTLPLRTFGWTSYVHIRSQNRSKLYPKAFKCLFISYSPTQKYYRY